MATLAWSEADVHPDGADYGERTVLSYFDAFAPAPEWDELVWWPPDVFALTNLVLDTTEGYRFVVAPPPGRLWPPLRDWDDEVRAAALQWASAAGGTDELPTLVRKHWDLVTRFRDVPLTRVRSGGAWELTQALLTLHAAADEACAGVADPRRRAGERSYEQDAWERLQRQGSFARLSPARVRIVPKTSFSTRGLTVRSMSRYLALCYESVEVRWRSVEGSSPVDRRDFNIVLVPWPRSVRGRDFRPVTPALIENMDTDVFGFFEFAPEASLPPAVVDSLLERALERAAHVDAVILPEAAVRPDEVAGLERTLARHGVTFLVAGVHARPERSALGRNYLHFGVRTAAGWNHYEQDKHHRWCLDEDQIRQYHLTRSLDPTKLWWEAIDIRERTLHIIDVGGGVTTAPMVCEDLARLDEVADLVRRIGPSLVVAVLLDGPQLATRWPCRYASVLADDPGSAVLTLTPYGMAARSRPPGTSRSRVVAHWNSRAGGLRLIELGRGSDAILLTTSVQPRALWTADGRRHENVPGLALEGIHQLRRRASHARPIASAAREA